jgi:hypothetical protein
VTLAARRFFLSLPIIFFVLFREFSDFGGSPSFYRSPFFSSGPWSSRPHFSFPSLSPGTVVFPPAFSRSPRVNWRLAGFFLSLPIIFPLFSFVNLVILVDSLPFLISLPHPTSSPFH